MPEVYGHGDERFRALGDQFRTNIEQGIDHGAGLAATLDGEFVVDLWGGYEGSFITMDRASLISCGFAPNRLVIDDSVYGDRLTEMWWTLGETSLSLS
jgi:hypothetical protein